MENEVTGQDFGKLKVRACGVVGLKRAQTGEVRNYLAHTKDPGFSMTTINNAAYSGGIETEVSAGAEKCLAHILKKSAGKSDGLDEAELSS